MSDAILQGDPPVTVTLRRSARARRMTLRVSRMDGKVTLTVPRGVSDRNAMAFAQERGDWIRKHLSQHVPPETIGIGSNVPVLGIPRQVVGGHGRRVLLSDTAVAVPGNTDKVGRKLQAYLKQLARSELAFASDQYSAALGRPYSKLSIRDTRSRWGSCSSAGTLMYSWRLIMAPAEVLTYVAAHEVAHLAEMNHSDRFWSKVTELYGDWKAPRDWLRREGHALHQFRFTD